MPLAPGPGKVVRPIQEVVFRLSRADAPGARWVALVGSFNNWDPFAHRMALGEDGWWAASLRLPPGTYTYMFLVNGFPQNDPADDGRVPCEWGGWYSVRVVRLAA